MDGNGRRYRRIAAVVGVAALGLAGAGLAASRLLPRPPAAAPPAEPPEEIDRAEYLLPLKAERSATGEELVPFSGFALSIDSEPPGAIVSVGGTVRGEAPVLANVSCSGAERLLIRAEKPGFRPARHEVGCRTDTLVKLTLRLRK